jgi:DNA repair protein RecN (Recombination protein N)
MLASLRVKGFAIIDELDVEFGDGFNVITGETGAGKSIIINALSSLINARVPTDVIRGTAPHAEVVGHCFQDGEEYIVKRIIGTQGRSRALVNDSPVTAKRLEELGDLLIHIYGQNESQQLLSREAYVTIVDRFLRQEEETAKLGEKVRRLAQVGQALGSGLKDGEERAREMDLLAYQLEEIERENIGDGEESRIRERLKVLKDAGRIKGSLETIEAGLYEDEQSAYALIAASGAALRPYSGIRWMEDLKEKIEALSFGVEEIVESIREHEKALEYEPTEAEELEERLSTILRLKEKYGRTHGSIDAFVVWAEGRLGDLRERKTDLAALEEEKKALGAEVNALAAGLSKARKEGASRVEKLVMEELRHLSMKGVTFKIVITDRDTIGEEGKDEIEFLLSTNPGEPARPLRKVASGGELSRIMLAIKKITGGEEGKTFIFDEIDTGIGGRVAEVVARRLHELSRKHQIICITHLPQIAVYGDHHFLVEKHQGKETTSAAISEVSGPARCAEIARMLGGITITAKTLEQAEEMLRNAQESSN